MNVIRKLITPELAEEYLKANVGNRAIRWSYVGTLAASMARGEWLLSPQGISFAASGRLIDGQHRLLAIQHSGAAIEMTVTFGVAEEVFSVLDAGLVRTLADRTGWTKGEAALLQAIANSMARTVVSLTPELAGELADKLTIGSQQLVRVFDAGKIAANLRAAFAVRALIEPDRLTRLSECFDSLVYERQDMPAQMFALLKWLRGQSLRSDAVLKKAFVCLAEPQIDRARLSVTPLPEIADQLASHYHRLMPDLLLKLKQLANLKTNTRRQVKKPATIAGDLTVDMLTEGKHP